MLHSNTVGLVDVGAGVSDIKDLYIVQSLLILQPKRLQPTLLFPLY